MSFMIVECAWCGETYTFGVVGMQMIGSGHECEANVPCETDGCERLARFLVAHDGLVERRAFACSDHLHGKVIICCQPRSVPSVESGSGTLER